MLSVGTSWPLVDEACHRQKFRGPEPCGGFERYSCPHRDLRETASELGWGALGDDPAGPPLDEDGEMAAR